MAFLRTFSALSLILVSLIASAVYVVAIVDPLGTQMANDEDPFGTPPSRTSSALALCISVAVGLTGAWLLIPRSKAR